MENYLRGKLCFKGDKGDPGKDAYEIKILEGTISDIPTGESSDVTVNYPTGFTKENTIVISPITKYSPLSSELTYWSSGETSVFVSMVGLNTNNISISITNNSGSTTNASYKVAIMKIE